ncbi:hypothetical protein GCM10010300_86310 [Streptomyces olivaceoviridis]|nr:hypothetical protein GCM10010300_86310 [Streptomyces olivaceoviridis]
MDHQLQQLTGLYLELEGLGRHVREYLTGPVAGTGGATVKHHVNAVAGKAGRGRIRTVRVRLRTGAHTADALRGQFLTLGNDTAVPVPLPKPGLITGGSPGTRGVRVPTSVRDRRQSSEGQTEVQR